MATGTVYVPHPPEFIAFTSLPSGAYAQPTGARNGYYLFPDGKVRIEINIKGITANTSVDITNSFPYPPTTAGSVNSGYFGSDGAQVGANKGTRLTVDSTGNVRVWSTSNTAVGLWLEYYP